MRNNSKGGMQTAGTGYALHCPKCDKPVARVLKHHGGEAYMHYTKTGVVWHACCANGVCVRRRSEPDALKALEVTAP
ncbi:hypothetical protein ACH6CV_16840 [Bacillota bacterium Meth-B3]